MLNRIRSAQDISVVHHVTSKGSFNNVIVWMCEINKYVSDGVNKLLFENMCDLTSQKTFPKNEAKELADCPNPKHEWNESLILLKSQDGDHKCRPRTPAQGEGRWACWLDRVGIVDRESAVPRSNDNARDIVRGGVRITRSGTTLCTTTPAPALTYVRAGALVPPPPCLGGGATRVRPGQ